MNVLFICDEYPPGKNGGIGTVVQVLGRELVRQGHNVYVVGLYAYSYGQKDYEEDKGVKVWRKRYGLNLGVGPDGIIHKILNKIPNVIKQHLNGRKAFANYISFIESLIKKHDINIIEIPDWNTFAMRIGFKVQWPKFEIPLLLKSHGSYTKIFSELNKTPRPDLAEIDQLLYDRADAISAVSDDTARKNKALFHIVKPIKTLYNGIEEIDIPLPAQKEKALVVYTGTLIPAKGIYQLVKAWNHVNKKHPSALLCVYGKGPVEPLRAMLSQEAVDTVQFKGHVKREELFRILSTATMAVFPSYSESFALAPMEAMAVGCPVIYTSRASGKELITDGDNGGLIDPDNVEMLAQKIIELLENNELQKQYSERGVRTIREKFTIFKIAKDHIEHYKNVISNFRA